MNSNKIAGTALKNTITSVGGGDKSTSDLQELFERFDKEFAVNQQLVADIYEKLAPVLDPEYATCKGEDGCVKKGYSTALNMKIDNFVSTLETQNERLEDIKSLINLYY